MLNLTSVMIGTKQPQTMVAFYEKVFEKPADMVDSENGFWGWQVGNMFLGILWGSSNILKWAAIQKIPGA